jgi:hypothetical protein
MSTPVTRGELREELEQLRLEFKQELVPLATKRELEPLATKRELELLGGALQARIASSEQRLIERIDGTEQRLSAELARHVGAIHEAMSAWFAASDEQYADLPGRMNRVEAAVFAPKQR